MPSSKQKQLPPSPSPSPSHGTHFTAKMLTPPASQPDGPAKAKLIFLHGFSDHINRYYTLFPSLAGRGIAVYGFDQRGWGRSVKKPADKGATGPTSQVLSEIASFIEAQIPEPDGRPHPPVFAMGHSNGGCNLLHLIASPEHQDLARKLRGVLLETPFIGFAEGEEPSRLKVFAGRLVGRLLPKQHLVHKIPLDYMSRDPKVVKDMEEDQLCHDTGTLEGLAGTLDRSIALSTGQVKLQKGLVRSMWFGLGTADKAVGYEASKKWYGDLKDEVEDMELKEYADWRHCLHAEIGKEEFYKDIADWILARSDSEDDATKSKL
ncbi:uncharacterized protein MKZ38_006774 [Zalerion maritima]|uniref:Serine aminopeptidase S33 domain-containing protein n=1 Tax=Zalerion maritima TaxID=339359 RepID=A0AAD5WPK0_9PEZI|nr:uncharacterized protein MKZ38_006774 [Zalerion maritima]